MFPSKRGHPSHVDSTILLESREKVDQIFSEFISAGAKGKRPEESLMYEPLYAGFIQVPFGLD